MLLFAICYCWKCVSKSTLWKDAVPRCVHCMSILYKACNCVPIIDICIRYYIPFSQFCAAHIVPIGCLATQFRCDGRCLPSSSFRCDGISICSDGSDETNCGTYLIAVTTTTSNCWSCMATRDWQNMLFFLPIILFYYSSKFYLLFLLTLPIR